MIRIIRTNIFRDRICYGSGQINIVIDSNAAAVALVEPIKDKAIIGLGNEVEIYPPTHGIKVL